MQATTMRSLKFLFYVLLLHISVETKKSWYVCAYILYEDKTNYNYYCQIKSSFYICTLTFFSPSNDLHALILARGGSKGIKLKNLAEIDGFSLLSRTIKTIQNSNCFKYIWVSTDDKQIALEAKKCKYS